MWYENLREFEVAHRGCWPKARAWPGAPGPGRAQLGRERRPMGPARAIPKSVSDCLRLFTTTVFSMSSL